MYLQLVAQCAHRCDGSREIRSGVVDVVESHAQWMRESPSCGTEPSLDCTCACRTCSNIHEWIRKEEASPFAHGAGWLTAAPPHFWPRCLLVGVLRVGPKSEVRRGRKGGIRGRASAQHGQRGRRSRCCAGLLAAIRTVCCQKGRRAWNDE